MKYALFLTAILSIASLADASSHNRILKKRTPVHFRRDLFDFGDQADNSDANRGNVNGGANDNKGVINAGNGPSVAPQEPVTDTTGTSTQTASDTTETQKPTGSGGLLDTILNPLTSTSTTSSLPSSTSSAPASSSAPPSSSSRSSSSSPPPSSAEPSPTPTPTPTPDPVITPQSTITAVVSLEPAESSPPAKPSSGVTTIQRNTIIVLVAIAGSIGVIALVWTIIRKWKFSPSSEFEDRMQPIDWQPTPDDGIVHRARPISHGSFTSGDSHGNDHQYNSNLRGQNFAADLPPHDLLSGANHAGYADLYRGPSPQPQMSEGIQRGPSINRGYY